jgi:hypothetical protein
VAPDAAPAGAVAFALPGPQALLLHQSLNELLHGIRGIQFDSQVGIGKLALGEIFAALDGWIRAQKTTENGLPIGRFDRTFSLNDLRVLRNAVELVMLELGQDEFDTRVGFSLAEGAALLDRFNAALLSPLKIDRPLRQTAH